MTGRERDREREREREKGKKKTNEVRKLGRGKEREGK